MACLWARQAQPCSATGIAATPTIGPRLLSELRQLTPASVCQIRVNTAKTARKQFKISVLCIDQYAF